MTRTQQARQHVEQGDWKAALSIYKTFRNTFTKDEKRTIEIAYECLAGHSDFYRQLGYYTDGLVGVAKAIICNKCINN